MPENLRPIETFRSRRAGERSEAIDRCADVRAFRDAAPRHCGTDVAAPRRLYHGLAGRAQRAAERRPFRSGRLCRLCDPVPGAYRAGHAHVGGVSAFGALRSEEPTYELQSLIRISYVVFTLE